MSAKALKTIENFDEAELKEFLENNGMGDCLKILDLEAINGHTFLNLKESDFSRWKHLIPSPNIKKLKKFRKEVKKNPGEFAFQEKIIMEVEKPSTNQNQIPFLKELEKKLVNKCNSIKDKNDNFEKQNIQQNINSGVVKQQQEPSTLTPNLKKKTDVIYQNVNSNLNGEIEEIPNKIVSELHDKIKYNNTTEEPLSSSLRNISDAGTKQQHELAGDRRIDSKYFLNMNRSEAEEFLRESAKEGAYLFRPSTQHYCALSVLFNNEVRHFGVKSVSGNKLELVTVGNDLQFRSLDQIVKYFKQNPTLRTANTQTTIKLSDPLVPK